MIRVLRRYLSPCRWGLAEHAPVGFSETWRADMADGFELVFPGSVMFRYYCLRCGSECG